MAIENNELAMWKKNRILEQKTCSISVPLKVWHAYRCPYVSRHPPLYGEFPGNNEAVRVTAGVSRLGVFCLIFILVIYLLWFHFSITHVKIYCYAIKECDIRNSKIVKYLGQRHHDDVVRECVGITPFHGHIFIIWPLKIHWIVEKRNSHVDLSQIF